MSQAASSYGDSNKQDFWFGPHVVLFTDLLDQRAATRDLGKAIRKGDGTREQIVKGIKESAGKVMRVRDDVSLFFKSYRDAKTAVPIETLTPEQRAIFDQFKRQGIQQQMFSDTVISFAAIEGGAENPRFRTREIYALLGASCCVMLVSLARGIPIRGGIEVDMAMDLSSNDIYGPALLEAYSLESKVAQYPRIVVGAGVIEFLYAAMNSDSNDPLSDVYGQLAKICMGLINYDNDGVPFVDYLGETARQSLCLGDEPDSVEAVTKGLEFVKREHERFCDNAKQELANREIRDGAKHAARYAFLRSYYEGRAPSWQNAKAKG